MRTTLASVFVVGTVTALASGCLVEVGSEGAGDEEVATGRQAVIGVDEFLYFRSNATGWGVDSSTRLFPFAGIPGLFSRIYNVTEPWMVSDVDTAVVTRTNQLDGWGTQQTFYRIIGPNPLPVPSGRPIAVNTSDPHFKVDYGTLGVHRVITFFTNEVQQAIQIDSLASACAGVCPGGLVCSLQPPAGIPTCSPP
jgi:hypothetical protein